MIKYTVYAHKQGCKVSVWKQRSLVNFEFRPRALLTHTPKSKHLSDTHIYNFSHMKVLETCF